MFQLNLEGGEVMSLDRSFGKVATYSLTMSNVGKAIITIIGWYKPSKMGGLFLLYPH